MLIKFNCPCSGPFITTQIVANQLIKAMGKCELSKGIVACEEIDEAIKKIERVLILEENNNNISNTLEVRFSQRAYPLVEMLKKAKRKNEYIMWHEI